MFNYASKLWRVDFDRMKMTNLLDGTSVVIEREASRPAALIKSAYVRCACVCARACGVRACV